MKLSVTIITKNEALNIERAIRSALPVADEIIVIDSQSNDNTSELATKLGAKVISHPFEGYGQQKNHAANLAQYDWILNIDADEELSGELIAEINKLKQCQEESLAAVYKIPRLTSFCGRWIYHGGWFPDFKARLYNKKRTQWTCPNVHEDLEGAANAKTLSHILYHYSFPTVRSQVETNVRYAQLGAKDLIRRKGGKRPQLWEIIIRPPCKFFECYLIKKGFLDGIHGFVIAVNAGHSMFMKYVVAYLES